MRRNWRTVGSGWFARPAATEFCDDSSTRVAWVVDEDLNHAMLAFEEEATGATLGVQRALEMDEQDRQFGMDSYCVVYGGSSHYGGIEVVAFESGLHVNLSAEAAVALGVDRELQLPLNSEQAGLARRRLPQLLGDE